MPADEYLGQDVLRVAVLPARAAYLVRQGSTLGLRRAVQEATTRWGGMTEPIVPVSATGRILPAWHQVVEVLDVQAVVNVDVDAEAARAAARTLALPLVPLSRIDRAGGARWSCHPSAVATDILNAPVLATSRASALWEAVAAGDLDEEHEKDFRQSRLVPYRPRSAAEVGVAQVHRRTLLDSTVNHFGEYSAVNGPDPAPLFLWVTRGSPFRDCLWFWNLRALRPLTFEQSTFVLVEERELDHWINFPAAIEAALSRPNVLEPDVVLCSWSVPNERLDALAQRLRLVPSTEPIRRSHGYPPPPPRPRPYTYLLNADPRDWSLFLRHYGTTVDTLVQMFRVDTTIDFPSPIQFHGSGASLLRVSGGRLDKLPKRRSVAELVSRGATWHRNSLQLATHVRDHYRLSISMPAPQQAFDAVLRDAAVGHRPSAPGQIAEALLTQIDVERLLEPGVYEAVVALTTPRSRDLLRELRRQASKGAAHLEQLAATWGGRAGQRFWPVERVRGAIGAGAVDAVERLAVLGWAHRGVEVVCSRCAQRSFVLLADTDASATCPACRQPQRYTQNADGVVMMYRLNALVDRASDQGVLPHLLVAAALQKREPAAHLRLGTIIVTEGSEAEVDVIGTLGASVVSGEVKTNAAAFTRKQIARDVAISAALTADVHVLACPTAVPDPVREYAATQCRRRGLELLVLDAEALRPAS